MHRVTRTAWCRKNQASAYNLFYYRFCFLLLKREFHLQHHHEEWPYIISHYYCYIISHLILVTITVLLSNKMLKKTMLLPMSTTWCYISVRPYHPWPTAHQKLICTVRDLIRYTATCRLAMLIQKLSARLRKAHTWGIRQKFPLIFTLAYVQQWCKDSISWGFEVLGRGWHEKLAFVKFGYKFRWRNDTVLKIRQVMRFEGIRHQKVHKMSVNKATFRTAPVANL